MPLAEATVVASGPKLGEKAILPTLRSAGVPVGLHSFEYGVLEGEGVRFPLHMTSRSPSNPFRRDHSEALLAGGSEKRGHSAPVKRRQIRLPRTTVPRKPLKQAKKTSTKGRGRGECH